MLLEQGTALTLGHAAPHTELDAVVQRVRTAFGDHRAVPADDGRLALGCAADEQFVGVGLAAAGLRNPGDTSLGLSLNDTINGSGSESPVSDWLNTCHQQSLRHTASRRPVTVQKR